jgi:outer membrane receptor for ferrienterochelin and colicins
MKKFLLLLVILTASLPAWAEEKTLSLDEVVVTATRVEESVENVAQDVTVVTKDEIATGSYTSVADTLKNVVGVTIRESGNRGALSTVSLRGSTPQQVLILVDGKRLNKPGDGMVDLNTLNIPLEVIERIEILRGASSSLYGADAMGGVINIITKAPAEPFTKITTSYGRFDTWDVAATTSRKIGAFGYMVSADREQSSGFRPNSDYEIWGLNSKFTFDITKDFNVDVNADFNRKESGIPGSAKYPSPKAEQTDENSLFGITFRFKDTIAKLYSHNARISYTDPAFAIDSNIKNSILGADIQSSILIGKSHLVTGGVELIAERLDTTDIDSVERDRKGVFIQDEISLSNWLLLDLGVRYDDFGAGSQLSPKAAVLIKATPTTTLRFAAGHGYRIPTLNDLYWPHNIYDYGFFIYEESGNPELKPEKSDEFEASVEQKIQDNMSVKALGFYKNVKNLIRWSDVDSDPSHDFFMPQNIARAKVKGVELSAFARFSLLDIETSYFYQDPKDRDTGERIADLPRHQVAATVTTRPLKGLTWSVEGRYVSNYTLPGDPDWCYFVLNSKLSKKLPLSFGEGEIFITGKNLLDREYETQRGYPMPPLEIIGGISVRF